MKHPLIEQIGQLEQPPTSARRLGYRMPAEWEPQEKVWVSRPHEESTWPGCFAPACEQFDALTAALSEFVTVKTTQSAKITTNDAWIRDYGPVFVVDDAGRLACHDFSFNCWGGKYGPWDADDVAPQHVALQESVPVWVHDFVLEGGAVDPNGVGTAMTTEQCLLHPTRNPMLAREQIERVLCETLDVRNLIWLVGGLEGDDTDGHIDDVARFINPRTVVAVRAGDNHPDKVMLERNWRVLCDAEDQDGNDLELVELPAPEPIWHDFPTDEWGFGGRRQVPASYANFLISNRCVIVPTFGQAGDDVALRVMERALPGYSVVGLRCEHLVVGLGGFHCLSQQQPRIRPAGRVAD